MNKLFPTLLIGSAIAMSGLPAVSADRDRGLDVSLGGIDANVGLDVGGRKGLDADVDVSVGGRKGIDADVDVTLGDRKGLDADINASVGNDVDADVNLSLGGQNGLDADIGATIGGGANADVDLSLGGSNTSVDPGSDPGADPDDVPDRPRLTTAQRRALNRMSTADKAALLKRCGSVTSAGYDAALVELCRLLRMSAAR